MALGVQRGLVFDALYTAARAAGVEVILGAPVAAARVVGARIGAGEW